VERLSDFLKKRLQNDVYNLKKAEIRGESSILVIKALSALWRIYTASLHIVSV